MSFGGHVLDMIRRNNQNQALRKDHRKNHRKMQAKSLLNSKRMNYPRVSKEKLERIKKDIRSKAKKDRQKMTIKIILITVVSVGIVYILFCKAGRLVATYLESI